MAEEQAGFTFVDKRKVVSGEQSSTAETETSAGSESPAIDSQAVADSSSASEYAGEDSTDAEAPDVYMMLQYCVQLLSAEAWQKMGLIADPRTGSVVTDLAQAKIAIDVVGDLIGRLETAPEDAVSIAEQRELKNVLNNLRLNYVNQKSNTA